MYVHFENDLNFCKALQELPQDAVIGEIVVREGAFVPDIVLLCDMAKFEAGDSECFSLHATHHPLPNGKMLVGFFLTWLREWYLHPLEMNPNQKHSYKNLTRVARKGDLMAMTPAKEIIIVNWKEDGDFEILCLPTQPLSDVYVLDEPPEEWEIYYITVCSAFDLKTNNFSY